MSVGSGIGKVVEKHLQSSPFVFLGEIRGVPCCRLRVSARSCLHVLVSLLLHGRDGGSVAVSLSVSSYNRYRLSRAAVCPLQTHASSQTESDRQPSSDAVREFRHRKRISLCGV